MQKALVVLRALAVRERARSLFRALGARRCAELKRGGSQLVSGSRPVSVFIPATGGRAGIV